MDDRDTAIKDVTSLRDCSVACAWAMGQFVDDYCLPLASGVSLADSRTLIRKATQDMRDFEAILAQWDRCATPQLLYYLVVANSDSLPQPVFDDYNFPTHQEAARAAAEMAYCTLAVLAEDLPDIEPDAARLGALFRRELLDFHQEYGNFTPDGTVQAVLREAAKTIRYLTSHPDLPVLTQPNDERTDASSKLAAEPKDPHVEARNQWIYEQAMAGKTWAAIVKQLPSTPFWNRPIKTIGGIKAAADRHADRHGLPRPPRRKPGRRPG